MNDDLKEHVSDNLFVLVAFSCHEHEQIRLVFVETQNVGGVSARVEIVCNAWTEAVYVSSLKREFAKLSRRRTALSLDFSCNFPSHFCDHVLQFYATSHLLNTLASFEKQLDMTTSGCGVVVLVFCVGEKLLLGLWALINRDQRTRHG